MAETRRNGLKIDATTRAIQKGDSIYKFCSDFYWKLLRPQVAPPEFWAAADAVADTVADATAGGF